ncbi:MAG: alpha/beta fold hydrolase [Rhodocyclales bacterium]|nr:alpha/beta fold hydrolase [Rhodocyclales bacterium]
MRTLMLGFLLAWHAAAHAQTDILIESATARSDSATNSPVMMRAILVKPAVKGDSVVLFFRGAPGYAKIQSVADKQRNMIQLARALERALLPEGIALAIMDCPTDQWGDYGGPSATNCLDDYRSSDAHADDVRGIIARLGRDHGYTKVYLLGHSMGTLSSRWLAAKLGNEIAGGIHSAAVNVPNPKGHYGSARSIPYDAMRAPQLHVHNEADACRGTPYYIVKGYAGNSLLTVRGGTSEGNPCGAGHLHSYQGIEDMVAKAIVSWIKTGKAENAVGG